MILKIKLNKIELKDLLKIAQEYNISLNELLKIIIRDFLITYDKEGFKYER